MLKSSTSPGFLSFQLPSPGFLRQLPSLGFLSYPLRYRYDHHDSSLQVIAPMQSHWHKLHRMSTFTTICLLVTPYVGSPQVTCTIAAHHSVCYHVTSSCSWSCNVFCQNRKSTVHLKGHHACWVSGLVGARCALMLTPSSTICW